MPSTLSTHDLTKSYGGRTVVRGVSIEVASGEIVGLLGPNGAGKTTTFYMTVGLTAPDAGRVVLDGEDVTGFSDVRTGAERYRLSAAGAVDLSRAHGRAEHPCDSRNAEALTQQAEAARSRAARRAQLDAARQVARVHAVRRRAPAHRDHARACHLARFILLDEPFAGIDPIAVSDIQKIIFHLKERGIGVLITDHNVRETLRITDRAYIVHDGVFSGVERRHRSRQTKRSAGSTSGMSSGWIKRGGLRWVR